MDSSSHARRTTPIELLDEKTIPWTYDPIACRAPQAWAYKEIIGAEFVRWDDLLRRRFGRPCRIVDLGCGPGGSSLWFAAKGHSVVGLDACSERTDIGRQIAKRYQDLLAQSGGTLRFECSDFFRFDPGEIDAVISVKTLHHVPDVGELIRKYAECLSPQGLFLVYDQVGSSTFSHHAQKLIRAVYPPGFCKTSWLHRQRAAAGALLRLLTLLPEEARSPDEVAQDPLEGVGQSEVIPAFERHFDTTRIRNMDPLRVLFLANDLKDSLCNKWVASPFLAINSILRLTGPSLEKSIEARMEHFSRTTRRGSR
jgi:SAM-dependent methyltransferase